MTKSKKKWYLFHKDSKACEGESIEGNPIIEGYFMLYYFGTQREAMDYLTQLLNDGEAPDEDWFLINTDFPMLHIETHKQYSVCLDAEK